MAAAVALAVAQPAGAQTGSGDDAGPKSTLSITPTLVTPTVSGAAMPTAGPRENANDAGGLTFDFHGVMVASPTLGFGPHPIAPGFGTAVPDGQSRLQLHSPAQVPDAAFSTWLYTGNVRGNFGWLSFSYGTARVRGFASFGNFVYADAGYQPVFASTPVNSAFLWIDLPKLLGTRANAYVTVGAITNAYGFPGRWDMGRYQTKLFGAMGLVGELFAVAAPITKRLSWQFEHGFGARSPFVSLGSAVADRTALAHHAHAGLLWDRKLELNFHHVYAWTRDLRGSEAPPQQNGSMQIVGAELKLVGGGIFGDLYLGVSRTDATAVSNLPGVMFVLHAPDGPTLQANYFGPLDSPMDVAGNPLSPRYPGTGRIDSVLFQYTYSIATLLRHPRPFWGSGPDVQLTGFGMYNVVQTDNPDFDGMHKFKWGGDVVYAMLPWLSSSVRYDRVNPNLADPDQAYDIYTGALMLRSQFITHEQIILQYSHYVYGSKVLAGPPFGIYSPDTGVLQLTAIVWW